MQPSLPFMTSEEVAQALGKTLGAFYKWHEHNKEELIPALFLGRAQLFHPDDVKALIEKLFTD